MNPNDDSLQPRSEAERRAAEALGRMLENDGAAAMGPDMLAGLETAAANELLQSLGALRRIDDALAEGTTLPTLGDYRLLSELGRGAMGIVYEAEQLSLGRRVALKVLRSNGLADETRVQRFRNEARAAASLQHPNIVPVYAFGSEHDVHYYVMQLVEGISLRRVLEGARADDAGESGSHVAMARRLLQRTPHVGTSTATAPPTSSGGDSGEAAAGTRADPNPIGSGATGFGATGSGATGSAASSRTHSAVARIVRDAARALAHAHEAGVLHRDIKPANLMIDHNAHVWVTDFGLAHFTRETSQLTVSGEVLGTLAYGSPEQVAGARVDERSDVYSLGVTLFELATLQLPFAADDRAQLIRKVLHDAAPSPRTLAPHLPRDLATIIEKAMAKEPQHRYPSARAFAEDLQAFGDGLPIAARPVTKLGKVLRWARRKPAQAGAIAGFALLLLLASAAAATAWRIALERDRAVAAEARLEIVQSRYASENHRRSLAPGRRAASLAELREAVHAIDAAELPAAEQRALRADLRADALDSLALPEVLLQDVSCPGNLAATDPTGRIFAEFADDGRRVQIRSFADGAVLAEHANDAPFSLCTFDHSGDWLLMRSVRPRSAYAWRWRRGTGANSLPRHFDVLTYAHQSGVTALGLADGRIAIGHLHQDDWRLLPARIDGTKYRPLGVALGPNHRWLAVMQFGLPTLGLIDLTGKQPSRNIRTTGSPWHIAFHPDGKMMAVGTHAMTVDLIDTQGQRLGPPLRGHRTPVTLTRWDATGNLLVTNGWDHSLHVWDVAARRVILRQRHSSSQFETIRSRADSGLILRAYDQRGGAIDVLRSQSKTSAVVPFPGRSAWLHPSGSFVVLCTPDALRFVDTATLRPLGSLPASYSKRMGRASLAWLADNRFALSGPFGCRVYTYARSRAQTRLGRDQITVEHVATVPVSTWGYNQVASSGNGQRFAWLAAEHIALFDANTLQELGRAAHGCPGAEVLHLSPDGRYATVDMHNDVSIPVLDLATFSVAYRHQVDVGGRSAFSPDSRLVAISSMRDIRIQELGSGEIVSRIDTSTESAKSTVAWLPDGSGFLCSLPRDRIQIFDSVSFEPTFSFAAQPRSHVYALESARDASVVVGVTVHEAHIWRLPAMRTALEALGLGPPASASPDAAKPIDGTPERSR
ncbi:MAG: WD40 repeat domain-containing serine/threonine protein kinase [Planctomycetota bacterium]